MHQTDDISFEDVYEAELTHLVNMATFILGSRQTAEDAVHDSFVRLHDRWHDVENPGAFVQRATINRCRDLLRNGNRRNKHLAKLATPDSVGDVTDNSDLSTDLVRALGQLDPKRRLIVVLRFYGRHTIAEIADLLSIPTGTAESNLYRGLEQLRRLLHYGSRV